MKLNVSGKLVVACNCNAIGEKKEIEFDANDVEIESESIDERQMGTEIRHTIIASKELIEIEIESESIDERQMGTEIRHTIIASKELIEIEIEIYEYPEGTINQIITSQLPKDCVIKTDFNYEMVE